MEPNKPTKDKYTITEVGTLLESMDQKIDHVLECLLGLEPKEGIKYEK